MDVGDWLTAPFGGDVLEWASVPLRIALGIIFIDAGLGKFRRGIGGFSGWLESLGVPFPKLAGPGVATIELGGGILLLAGLLVPWIAIPLAINMMVATYVNKFKEGLPFQGSSDKQGYELDVLLVFACIALILMGAGPASIDSLLS
ncbi:MAG: DoxX family protein [Chloroflexota bacterium]|nr:DoxX family protein [Chloroflexota bacterium]